MGGNAFPSLQIARLSSDEHAELHRRCSVALRALFDRVEITALDPDKTEHGDLDLIVLDNTEASDEDVRHALAAVDIVPGRPTSNFAVPLRDRYAQVDVHRCATSLELDNKLVLRAYGHLHQILGDLVAECGLALTPDGLATSARHPRFVLTQHVADAFAFFGLDVMPHRQGFTSREAIFRWIESAQVSVSGGEKRPLVDAFRPRRPRRADKEPPMQQAWRQRREAASLGTPLECGRMLEAALQYFACKPRYEEWLRDEELRKEREAEANRARKSARRERLAAMGRTV